MGEITTVGLDIGKRVLQVHGADAEGRKVLQRKLRREEVRAFFAWSRADAHGAVRCGKRPFRPTQRSLRRPTVDLVAWIIPFNSKGLRCASDRPFARIQPIPGISRYLQVNRISMRPVGL